MASTSKGTWKAFERIVAATDWNSKRNPLSGANSRQDDGSPRGGDVILPARYDVLVECKYRASHAHHTLFEAVQADAAKHRKRWAILYSKVKRTSGWLVVLDGALWTKVLALPEVQKLLEKP